MYKKAHAKINLSLNVSGKRADGYHLLDMVMQTVDFFDSISISKTHEDEISLRVIDERNEAGFYKASVSSEPSIIPVGRNNLMVRAAGLMRHFYPGVSGIHMELKKRIPLEAGLGGGSSDAAAVICCINELFCLGLSTRRMEELGRMLGADVPFFIQGGTQRVRGIGDKLEVLPSIALDPGFPVFVLLIKPDIKASTTDVYAAWDRIKKEQRSRFTVPDVAKQVLLLNFGKPLTPAYTGGFLNEVKNVLFYALPKEDRIFLNGIKELLTGLGARAACMSGSGTVVFGLFDTERDLINAASAVRESAFSARIADIVETRMCPATL